MINEEDSSDGCMGDAGGVATPGADVFARTLLGLGACALLEDPKPKVGADEVDCGGAEVEAPKPLKADSTGFC